MIGPTFWAGLVGPDFGFGPQVFDSLIVPTHFTTQADVVWPLLPYGGYDPKGSQC